jgi:ETC complex I subunit conserved region
MEEGAHMSQARIYQLPKNAMQSGRARTAGWVLDYAPGTPKRADPLMGWAGSSDTLGQLRLSFPSLDAAKAYAESKGISYSVMATPERRLKLQAYADNFR